jgi:hypothetical protein
VLEIAQPDLLGSTEIWAPSSPGSRLDTPMKPATNGPSGCSYLAETLELARDAPPGEARDLVLDVIDNHDNLKLGLE